MSKRLELVWPNKEKLLRGLDENGKPIWGDKNDLEPRLLVQLKSVGKVNADNPSDLYAQGDNLLIKGDNLLALKSLEQHFAGKIQCVYVDIPFNTGNAFEHYEDGLEHTIWLSLMKSRFEILKKLLKKEGALVVHIDHGEKHYLKVLMDEIFGRRNYVQEITVEARSPSGYKVINPGLFTAAEYLLVYAREKTTLTFKTLFKKVPYDKQYSHFIEDPSSSPRDWNIKRLREVVSLHLGYNSSKEAGDNLGKAKFQTELEKFAIDHAENVARLETIGRKAGKRVLDVKARSEKSPRRIFVLNKSNGNKSYIWHGGEIVFYSSKVKTVEGELSPTMMETNIWNDIGWEGIQNEGEVSFKYGKKPEKLVARVIEFLNPRNDWVLDSFLGSATTAAVAHKLGCKWIGIEIGEQAETHCLPRLTRVVSGKDQTGISKQVGWKGGGGFRYCVLGESLFQKDADTGLVMINPKYNNGLLVAAVCNLENFHLNNDSIFNGVRGNTFAHIAEDKVTQVYLDVLVEQLPEDKSLIVYCLKRANGMQFPERVQIKRIPKDLQIPRYLTNGEGGDE